MRLTGSRAYYRPSPPKMPPGLVELMEGLTKEVLKHNPSDIYGFCAGHMQQLLEKRDGPSRQRTLSLEEKIAKAQEKVRQRAEKRRQEYDKNILLQSINDSENNITSNSLLAQQATVEKSLNINSDKESEPLPSQDNVMQNLKVPVHHEHSLEKSSEVEISHESSADNTETNLPQDVTNETQEIDTSATNKKDTVETERLAEVSENVTNVEATNNTSDGNIEQVISPSKAQDTEISNMDDEILEHRDEVHAMTPDVPSESQNPIEQSNEDIENVSQVNDGVEANQTVDSVLSNENSTSIVATDNENGGTNEKVSVSNSEGLLTTGNIENIQEPNHTDQDLNKIDETNNDINKIHYSNETELTPSTENLQPSIDIMDANQEDNKDPQQTDNSQNIEQSDSKEANTVSTSEIKQEVDSEATQNSNTENDILQTENADTQSPNNDPSEIPSVAQPELIADPEFKNYQGTDINNLTNNAEKDSNELIKTVVPESEGHLNLPAPDVDSDIQTLVTENSVKLGTTSDVKEISSHSDLTEDKKITDEKVDNDKPSQQCAQPDLIGSVENSTSEPVSNSNTENENNNKVETSDNTNGGQNVNTDTSNMDLETAAVTIQKVFRTFLFKSRGSTFEDNPNDDETNFMDEDDKNKEESDFPIASALNIERRPHGLTRMDTVLQTVNEEKSLSLSTDDSSTLSSAATIIQAHVRGFLVRNRLNSNKTLSTNSLAASNSNEPSITSLEADNEQHKNKTILNIHIVPEGGNYLSRDESLITSMDLSLDSSPPSSVNLHPLGFDVSERRKQLKREDAIQSISPPSNNSGKLSEDMDSVKEFSLHDNDTVAVALIDGSCTTDHELNKENGKNTPITNGSLETGINSHEHDAVIDKFKSDEFQIKLQLKRKSLTKMSSDELDVVTPYISNEDSASSMLTHSGEFHDAVLPTRVSRSDTTVVSEFKNVLVYFLLWNHS